MTAILIRKFISQGVIFNSYLLTIFFITTAMTIQTLTAAEFSNTQIIGALDWEERGGIAAVVDGPWRKCGVVIEQDQPYELEDGRLINPFPVKKPCEEGAPWFYWIFSTKDNYYNLVMKDNKGKHLLSRNGIGDFTLDGLPEDMMAAAPEVFKLGPQQYRMYFWTRSNSEASKIRVMVAESSDLHHWKVANGGKPILSHHGDSTWGDGLPASRICNDATTIYHNSDGSWEFFSAAVTSIRDPQSPYSNKELCPGFVRIVMRWTSPDGIHLSEPEVVLTPDAQDSPATQCYYLSILDLEPYTVGIFGNFNIQNQRLLMEPVWSRDHRHWSRATRRALFEKDYVTASSITDIVLEADGTVSLYYTVSNTDHEGRIKAGTVAESKLCKAQVPRRKFFGRQLKEGVTLVSPVLRYTGKNPKIYVSEDAELTSKWQDLFSTTSQVVPVQLNGDVAEIRLSEVIKPTFTGYLRISGRGIVYDAEY